MSTLCCAAALIVFQVIAPAAREMYPEFGIPGTRFSAALFAAQDWMTNRHGALALCAIPFIASVAAGALRAQGQRPATGGLVSGLLGALTFILLALTIVLTPAVLLHRQLQSRPFSDSEQELTRPERFSGFRALFARLASQDLDDATAFAAGAELHVHAWDATHELLVIEPCYSTIFGVSGGPTPYEFSFDRGASGNGDLFVVLHDTTNGACTLVGRLSGNGYELKDEATSSPKISTTTHCSARESLLTDYAWDGKIFKQVAQRTVRSEGG